MTILTGWLDFNAWPALFGLGGAGVLGVLWFFGLLPAALQIIGIVAELLRPLAKAVGDALAVVLRWFGEKLWAGVLDIVDSFATILTVAVLVGGFYFAGKLADDVKYAKLEAHYSSCMTDLAKAKRKPSVVREPVIKWPWE